MSLMSMQFLLGTINTTPDFFLDELQEILQVYRGVNVSQATVWRTLKRAGFTMKKVCLVEMCCSPLIIRAGHQNCC
jgi:transposase